MPIDTSSYPNSNKLNSDPLTETLQLAQLKRNLAGNVNKAQGGMPMTQDSLDKLGAGQLYPVMNGQQ